MMTNDNASNVGSTPANNVGNESNSQNLNVTPSNNAQSAPVTPSNNVQKLYTDEDLNNVIRSKQPKFYEQGYEKGYEAARSELAKSTQTQNVQSQVAQQHQPVNSIQPPVTQANTLPTDEHIKNLVAQQLQEQSQLQDRQRQEMQFERLRNDFVSKVEAKKSKYSDFDTVVGALNLRQIPEIWMAASQFDDPASIVYHLGKDLTKLANLRNLSYSPDLVTRGMQELLDSVKNNEAADKAKENVAPAPVSRLKPASVGMDDGKDASKATVTDFRKMLKV
jgi:hypothetical protein